MTEGSQPTAHDSDLLIRAAQPLEAARLTEIAHAAKAHWGYPASWIAAWEGDLTITPSVVDTAQVFLVERRREVVGFYVLAAEGETCSLEHLWVDPPAIGTGVGRVLIDHAKKVARARGAIRLEAVSDPNAEGFYLHMGATRVGEERGEVEGNPRILPVMEILLSP